MSAHSRRASRLDLATSELPKVAHVWSMQGELKGHASCNITGQNFQFGQAISSRLIPVASLSHQNALFVRNLTVHIPHSPYYKYSYTHEMLRASRENFERETLEKNKIDSSTIFILWFSKFLYSHPLHWYILERYISQILISPYPYLWGGILVFGKQFERDQFILVDAMGDCGIW